MNLLPIPILDGSLILLALVEAATKKPVNPKLQKKIQLAGLVVIVLIFAVGLFGDIRYFINKAFEAKK